MPANCGMKTAGILAALAVPAVMAACAGEAGLSEAREGRSDIPAASPSCAVELFVLGAGQDAAAPQIGYHQDPAWDDPTSRLLPTSLALADHATGARYLFEATPNIARQLKHLNDLAPLPNKGGSASNLGVSGIFITHAHIGHYAGLMFIGREAAGAKNMPVYTMPRMADFLSSNGPWAQLVDIGNITLKPLEHGDAQNLLSGISVTPYQVPHRDEYSETAGYVIFGGDKKALFIPDIDSWEEWHEEAGIDIEAMIASVDYAFLDATFYSDNELPGRDMSLIPHPRVSNMMDRFDKLPERERRKINFIHINHTNPIRYETSPESRDVAARGYNIARRGDRKCLKFKN